MSRAFTLIELLVMIALLSVLVAILLPALEQAREKGRGANCLGNLRQIAVGMTVYAGDHHGIPPLASTKVPDGDTDWIHFISSYMGTHEQIFNEMGLEYKGPVMGVDAFICPSDRHLHGYKPVEPWGCDRDSISYGYNSWHVGWHQSWWAWGFGQVDVLHRIETIPQQSKTLAFADGMGNGRKLGFGTPRYSDWISKFGYSIDIRRHRLGANAVFVDGHGQYTPDTDYHIRIVNEPDPTPTVQGDLAANTGYLYPPDNRTNPAGYR